LAGFGKYDTELDIQKTVPRYKKKATRCTNFSNLFL